MDTKKRLIYLIIGPVLFAIASVALKGTIGGPGAMAIGTLLWMVFWWVTQPVALTVTAFLPVGVNAIFGMVEMGDVISQYASGSIILVFGSCLLTIPWATTGLDKRVALKVLSLVGPSMKSQITVWLLASMIFSSCLPNVAVCALFTPIAVDRDVDIAEACGKIIAGRRFDNGLICLGEQTAFVPEEKFDEFIAEFRKQGGYYAEGKEATDKLREGIFPGGGPINRDVVGLSAEKIAEKLGIEVPEGTKVLGATATVVGKGDDLCREKLCPVINIMPYGTFEEGVANMVKNLEFEGKGHSVAIHSNNPEHVEYCGIHCSVSRCIVNQPAGTTGGGSPTNGYPPTTTLGCGSWGNNSFSGNFNYEHLMNITRVGYPYEESYLPDPEKAWD